MTFLFCSSGHLIDRDIIPVETIDTEVLDEKCASTISRNFEIGLKEIKEDELEDILDNSLFFKKNTNKGLRFPRLIFFKIAVRNTGDIPLEIGQIKIYYGNTVLIPLNAEYLINKYSSTQYYSLDYDLFLSLFKFDSEELCKNNVNYKTDIVRYPEHTIQPDHTVLRLLLFEWIPPEVRKFSLSVEIKSDIIQKVIDFKLMRFEYRKSGKYFVKPGKEKDLY